MKLVPENASIYNINKITDVWVWQTFTLRYSPGLKSIIWKWGCENKG